MHKIFELKEMEQEQLLTLASELKIKNYKKLSREDLDLCAACAKALQVRGDIVAGETSSPREFPAESAGRISTEEDKTT